MNLKSTILALLAFCLIINIEAKPVNLPKLKKLLKISFSLLQINMRTDVHMKKSG